MSTTFRDSRGASSTTRQSWWLPVLVACHIAPLPVAANVDTVALPTPTLRATHAVFTEGEKDPNGFAVAAYRIPGFIAVPGTVEKAHGNSNGGNTTLIVLAEARKYSCSDMSPHSLVAKRSTDDGATWSDVQMVVDPAVVWGPSEGGRTGGAVYDPTPVLDSNNNVHVIFSYCPARYMHRPPIPQAFELWEVVSKDAGVTWGAPRNLSAIVPPLRQGEGEWIVRTAGGGGNGIRITNGPHKGRLVVPGYHGYKGGSLTMSHVLLSDDDGAAWRLSHSFFANTGEGSVAETGSSGSLVFVARRIGATHCSDPVVGHCAATMVSSDGGETWTDPIDVGALPDPGCKNTVAAWPEAHALVHGGSHSPSSRTNVSALFSTDGGRSWGGGVMVWESPRVGGYVATQTWGQTLGIVFENVTCNIAIGLLQ